MSTYTFIMQERIRAFIEYVGGVSLLLVRTIGWVFVPPLKKGQLIYQMKKTGVDSCMIVFLTAF